MLLAKGRKTAVKELLKALRMTQSELAKKASYSSANFSQALSLKREIGISPGVWQRIMAVLREEATKDDVFRSAADEQRIEALLSIASAKETKGGSGFPEVPAIYSLTTGALDIELLPPEPDPSQVNLALARAEETFNQGNSQVCFWLIAIHLSLHSLGGIEVKKGSLRPVAITNSFPGGTDVEISDLYSFPDPLLANHLCASMSWPKAKCPLVVFPLDTERAKKPDQSVVECGLLVARISCFGWLSLDPVKAAKLRSFRYLVTDNLYRV